MNALAILVALVITTTGVLAQSTSTPLKITTYNLHGWPAFPGVEREAALQHVLDSLRPDILLLQGIDDSTAVGRLRDVVLAGMTIHVVMIPGGDVLRSLLLIDTSQIHYVGSTAIDADQGIDHHELVIIPTSDTLHILSATLAEGSDSAALVQRQLAAATLRTELAALPPTHYRMVAGTLNIASPEEEAYLELTTIVRVRGGEVIDPLGLDTMWDLSPSAAKYHTASTRKSDKAPGLVRRADMIMVSNDLLAILLSGSYSAYGNDGQHYGSSVSVPPNDSVTTIMAMSIEQTSDHLPVSAVFSFGGVGVGLVPGDVAAIEIATLVPLPANHRCVVTLPSMLRNGTLRLLDARGLMVRVVEIRDAREIILTTGELPSGLYVVEVTGGRQPIRAMLPVVH